MNPTTKAPSRLHEVRGNVRANWQTSPEVFETNVETLADDQREILQWWFYHGRENDLTLKELGRRAGVSSTSLSRAFSGKYEADLANLCLTLEAAKENLHQSVANPDFIMTALGKLMWGIFDTTRAMETVTFVWGVKGIGKTTVAKEYKRLHNHGRTFYHRCSPAMTFGQFVTSLASSMGIPSKRHSHLRLRDKIIAMLAAGKRLLVLDELHQLFLRKQRSRGETAVLICEFIREIYDRSNCGMCLIGTRALVAEFLEGENAAALEQLLDRGLEPIELPAKPTKEDAATVIKHFGLRVPGADDAEAAGIISDIFAASGLRKLVLHLRGGAAHAAGLKEPYGWPHFVAAHRSIATLTRRTSGK